MAEELKRAGIGCPYCGNDLYVDFDVCPHCGREVPRELLQLIQVMRKNGSTHEISKNTNTPTLTHFDDFEEDSKTKIGTFERLLADKYAESHTFGFNDTDYAPLVNLLSSVLELELSYAVYDKFLMYWMNLHSAFKIQTNFKSDRTKCTLGDLNFFLGLAKKDDEEKFLPEDLKENWRFAESKFGKSCGELKNNLDYLTDKRNKAAHKSAISKQDFHDFFAEYQPFYEQYMPAILQLKKRGDSPGFRLFVDLRKNFPNFRCTTLN